MDVTVPSTMVEDLLESDGSLRHDRLVAAVAQGDVGLETVTDEVLLLCGRDAMADPQDHWTPWLLRQPNDHVDVARTTTLRYLVSRGRVTMDDDRLQALEPMLADLPGRLRSRASVVAASSVDGHQGLQSVSAIGTSRGLWVVQARGEPEPFASVQEVGEEDLLAIAGHLLQPAHT